MRELIDPLVIAAAEGWTDEVRRLIAAGADPNRFEQPGDVPPLLLAALNGHPEAMRALIAGGADLHAVHHHYGSTLAIVATFGRAESLGPLLESGVDIDADLGGGRTALMETARENAPTAGVRRYADLARALIAAGANVEARDREGMTPLMYAAGRCNAEAIRLLIAAGCDVSATNQMGRNALDLIQSTHPACLLARKVLENAGLVWKPIPPV